MMYSKDLDPAVGEPTPAHVRIVLPTSDWCILDWLISSTVADPGTTPYNKAYYSVVLDYFNANYTPDYRLGKWAKGMFTVKPLGGMTSHMPYGRFHTMRDALSYSTRHNARPGCSPVGVFFNRQAVRDEGLGL